MEPTVGATAWTDESRARQATADTSMLEYPILEKEIFSVLVDGKISASWPAHSKKKIYKLISDYLRAREKIKFGLCGF